MPATLDHDAAPQHPKESEKHIFVASKSPIETISEGIPQFDEYAPLEVSITARKTDGAAKQTHAVGHFTARSAHSKMPLMRGDTT